MIDKNEIKKMWVWGWDKDKKVKRYVLYTADNSCVAITQEDEHRFEAGYVFHTKIGRASCRERV